jgi:hypothetical protein
MRREEAGIGVQEATGNNLCGLKYSGSAVLCLLR